MLIWLVSYPRSGNRWSRDMLTFCFGWPSASIYSMPGVIDSLGIAQEGDDARRQKDRLILTLAERRQLAQAYKITILKTHELPEQTYLPGEFVIHVVRHPGAAFWSYLHYLSDVEGKQLSLDTVIEGLVGFGNWSEHTQKWLDAGNSLGQNYLRYSYEEMHKDMDGVIARIGAWLGKPPIAGSERIPSLEVQRRKTRKGLIRNGQVDEWRQYFTPEQYSKLYTYHGKTMQRLGYDVPVQPTKPVAQHVINKSFQYVRASADRIKNEILRRYQQIVERRQSNTPLPAVIHITHHKAGSQWVAEIFRSILEQNSFIRPQPLVQHFNRKSLQLGIFIPTVYKPRPYVEAICSETNVPVRRFLVIRDLRDTLISYYFSVCYSHEEDLGIRERREYLRNLTLEQGRNAILRDETFTDPNGNPMQVGRVLSLGYEIQKSWLGAENLLVVRYEDLVADEHRYFKTLFDYSGLPYRQNTLHSIVSQNSFQTRTGRAPGQEDIYSHLRKGIPGDWRNYFTESMKEEFKARYGDVLIAYGYETSNDW